MNRVLIALTALLFTAPACAQPSLLGTHAEKTAPVARAPRPIGKMPITNENRDAVTWLARFVAAELGRDGEAPLETRTAVAATALREANRIDGRPTAKSYDYRINEGLRDRYRRLLSEGYDGAEGLSTREIAWLNANGYAHSVEAARAALLDNADPARGAQLWSDLFSEEELTDMARRYDIVAVLPTSRGDILFYRGKSSTIGRP